MNTDQLNQMIEKVGARQAGLKQMVNELRPTDLEPFAAILSKPDMATLRALDALGHFMCCTETGQHFCPELCATA